MAYKVVALCDQCGKEGAMECGVTVDGDRYDLDLCKEHGDVLRELAKVGRRRDDVALSNGVTNRLYDSRLRNVPQ